MFERAFVLSAMLLAVTCTSASSRTWYVNPDGTGDALTIQAGIDSATAGDNVEVTCGTYHEFAVSVKSGIYLTSETGAPGCVTVDAQELGCVFICDGVDSTTHIVGFTVTGGLGAGGGMRLLNGASPGLTNLAVSSNTSSWMGGGLWCDEWGAPVLSNVRFEDNTAPNGGGGAYFAEHTSPRLYDVVFAANDGVSGGGMYVNSYSNPILIDCRFINNTSDGWGGGLMIDALCTAYLHGVRFTGNEAHDGGGLASYYFSTNRCIRCKFAGNTASGYGGGVYCHNDSLRIEDCTFVDNTAGSWGGGVASERWPYPRLVGCTMVGNGAAHGGGIANSYYGGAYVSRTIIAYSQAGGAVYTYGGQIVFDCSDLYGNVGGDWVGGTEDQSGVRGNFSAPPAFCDVDYEDYRLCEESLCAPGNHPDSEDCGLIGAWPVACACEQADVAHTPTTWGRLKAMYR